MSIDTIVAPTEDIHPAHPPVVPIPQDPFIPKRRLARLVQRFSGAQFLRYVCVGGFNTVFGYCSFAIILFLLNAAVPSKLLYLTVVLASLLSTPINITIAYFGYKFFVFRTRGNYLAEWFRCFGVYGVGMLPGLLLLSGLTRLLQTLFHAHSAALHVDLATAAAHLHGSALHTLQKVSNGRAAAGYIAGALVQGFTMIFSFVGHKKVTFRQKETA